MMKMIKVKLFVLLTMLSLKTIQAQNGYTLEFEDVMTLSVDSLLAPSAETTITKSFIVPAGTVLKISSGHLSNYNTAPQMGTLGSVGSYSRVVTGFLKINDHVIIGADSSMKSTFTSNGAVNGSIFKIKPDQPIWAPSNATVTLGVLVSGSPAGRTGSLPLFSNWISGVLFRKVPN